MNDDERRQRDWLDAELDRLALEGGRSAAPDRVYQSEDDRALSETADLLRRLDARQADQPDPGFLRHLERELMPTTTTSRSWSDPVPGRNRQFLPTGGHRFRDEPAYRRSSRFSFVATLALALAIVAATLIVTTWDRATPPPPNEPGRFAAATGDSTPGASDDDVIPTAESEANDDTSGGSIPPLPGGTVPTNDVMTWAIPFPEGTRSAETGLMLIENGHVYRQITTETGQEGGNFRGIQAINTVDGTITWQVWTNWLRNGFNVDEWGVYSATAPNTITAFAIEDGAELWSASFFGSVATTILRDGTLYVWDTSHRLTAIDTESGEALWSNGVEPDEAYMIAGNGSPVLGFELVAGESTLVVITGGGTLTAFDRATGEVSWSQPGYHPIYSHLTVTGDYLLVLSISGDRMEYNPAPERRGVGVDLNNGDVLWAITATGPISNPVAPGGTEMFHFIADTVETEESPAPASTPVIDFDHDGSNDLWPAQEPANIYGDQGPEGAAYVFGIDAATGQIVWQRGSSGSGFGGLYTSNSSSERLWALTYDNHVVLLGGETGIVLNGPITIPDPVKGIVAGSLEEGLAAMTLGGTLYGFGQVPPDQQG